MVCDSAVISFFVSHFHTDPVTSDVFRSEYYYFISLYPAFVWVFFPKPGCSLLISEYSIQIRACHFTAVERWKMKFSSGRASGLNDRLQYIQVSRSKAAILLNCSGVLPEMSENGPQLTVPCIPAKFCNPAVPARQSVHTLSATNCHSPIRCTLEKWRPQDTSFIVRMLKSTNLCLKGIA